MKKSLILPFLLPIMMSGCGGGGSDDKVDPGAEGKTTGGKNTQKEQTVSGAFPDLPSNTRWEIVSAADTDSCDEFPYTFYELSINYTKANNQVEINVSDFESTSKDITLIDSNDTSITFSGKIEGDEEVTTFKSVTLNFVDLASIEEGGATITGVTSWSWSDGEETCDGTSKLEGEIAAVGDKTFDGGSNVTPSAWYSGNITYTIGSYTGTKKIEAGLFGENLLLEAYDDEELSPNASVISFDELSMKFIPFNGAGEYRSSETKENASNVELSFNHVEANWPTEGETPSGGKEFYCYSKEGEIEAANSSVTATITENGEGFSGTMSGNLACVLSDQLGNEASSSEVISIEFSLQKAEVQE